MTDATRTIRINRAPVLALWAAVVAQRLGHDRDAALTLGQALAGLNAHSKGVRLGIYAPTPAEVSEARHKARSAMKGVTEVDLLGRRIPVVETPDGMRALVKDAPDSPESVERYLRGRFGDASMKCEPKWNDSPTRIPPATWRRMDSSSMRHSGPKSHPTFAVGGQRARSTLDASSHWLARLTDDARRRLHRDRLRDRHGTFNWRRRVARPLQHATPERCLC